MFSFVGLYGVIKTPLVFAFKDSSKRFFGANLNPSGKITTAPTFSPPFCPFPKICFSLYHKEFLPLFQKPYQAKLN